MEETNNQDENMEINDDVENGDESLGDIEEEDSDYDDDQWYELNKDIFHLLKKNASTITDVGIDCYHSFFHSIDWKGDGNCIANNTHLKIIRIYGLYILGEQNNELPKRKQLQDFFSCIYRNSSITALSLSLSSIYIVDEFGGGLIEDLQGHPSLKILEIGRGGRLGSIGCAALGKVLTHAKSRLKFLHLRQCELDDKRLRILCDALLGNSTLKKLNLTENTAITSVGWRALSTVLRHPNCKLVKLDLHNSGINDEGSNILGSALCGLSSLKILNLGFNNSISSEGWQTLLNQLSQTSLVCLDLDQNDIGNNGLAALAAIGTLQSLNVSRIRSITPSGWRSFFNSIQTRGIQLKKLDISCNKVGDVGVAALGSLLSNMSTLRTLNMRSCVSAARLTIHGRDDSNSVSSQGWIALFTSLHGSNLDLVKLHLGNNNIDDEGMQLLVPLVSRMSSLKHLTLDENRRVTPAGWQAFTQLLQSPNFALEKLRLDDNRLNDNTLIPLTSALVNNKTLQKLDLYDCLDDDENELITERGWAAISSLLCNKTNIMDTYNSNHILHDLGCDPSYSSLNEDLKLPDDLSSYLELNKNKDKVEVARQKILQTHLSTTDNDTSNLQDLLDMELEMMPTVIAWIGRPAQDDWKGKNVSGLSTMYNLMRRLPDLFDSSDQKNLSAGKRKHGL